MSEAFFRKNLMRCRQLQKRIATIREPNIDLVHHHVPILGTVTREDIHISFTLLCMAVDESEHMTDMSNRMLEDYGQTYLWQREHTEALRLKSEVEILSTELQTKLCLLFGLVYEDFEGYIFLYRGWKASLYRPDQFVVPPQFPNIYGHA
jgi:hypothetical protein